MSAVSVLPFLIRYCFSVYFGRWALLRNIKCCLHTSACQGLIFQHTLQYLRVSHTSLIIHPSIWNITSIYCCFEMSSVIAVQHTSYCISVHICKSNHNVQTTWIKGFCHILQLYNFENFTDPDIYTSWFLASSLRDSDNTISVFFAVEKQTGLWTDHYINSFLKGGSYFKRGWRNAKRDLNFNLNLFQQVKGSFERGFQQRWWYLKVINKHLNLQWGVGGSSHFVSF